MSQHPLNNHRTAVGRWSCLGPYYAMFPTDFAFQVIEEYSRPGDAVLDPFAGRASSVYAAAVTQREAVGIEINPVGWLYGHVKLKPASKQHVLARVEDIWKIAEVTKHPQLNRMPQFFRHCYSRQVLNYLLFSRDLLRWKERGVDATLMALILVNLHGKKDGSLSNQMRQGKAMSPDYSVNWWNEHDSLPPDIHPVDFLRDRIGWRYAKGTPEGALGKVYLGDSTKLGKALKKKVTAGQQKRFNLLFTSPPYREITDYYYDQWLRLWMLGGPAAATRTGKQWQGRFASKDAYRHLLTTVFQDCAEVLDDRATVYVRTDARDFTLNTTIQVLGQVFPQKELQVIERPFLKQTQTALFGDKEEKPGEMDLVLRPH
ncbi:MAG: site-specific DNA-methyltransferase [Acidobacteria bacterium]|nr:site-specific DNA-methyltransferase [Acidobacteriota bacterium]MBI3421893.1 site-specific DNA-methyltransferase [Acidobacteriota bacterium]